MRFVKIEYKNLIVKCKKFQIFGLLGITYDLCPHLMLIVI